MATSTYAAPLGGPIFRAYDSAGNPLSGGLVYVYQAGTTTADFSYPTQADALADTNVNANPVVLDSAGTAQIWLQAARLYKIVLKDSSSVTQWTVDDINPANGYPATSGTASFLSSWVQQAVVAGQTVLSVRTTTGFTVGGQNAVDQTGTYHAGRRVKTITAGGTSYGTVWSNSYTAGFGTQVNLRLDAGSPSLSGAVTAIYYGIEPYASPSYLDPRTVIAGIKNADQTGFATVTKVTPFTEQIDSNSEFVTDTFTCVYDGNYQVHASAEVSDTSASQDVILSIYKNGAEVKKSRQRSAATGGNHTTLNASHVFALAATDTIDMRVTGTVNTSVYGTTGTALTVTRIA